MTGRFWIQFKAGFLDAKRDLRRHRKTPKRRMAKSAGRQGGLKKYILGVDLMDGLGQVGGVIR